MYVDQRALDGRSSAYATRTGRTVDWRLTQNTGIINAYAFCLCKLGFYRLLNLLESTHLYLLRVLCRHVQPHVHLCRTANEPPGYAQRTALRLCVLHGLKFDLVQSSRSCRPI